MDLSVEDPEETCWTGTWLSLATSCQGQFLVSDFKNEASSGENSFARCLQEEAKCSIQGTGQPNRRRESEVGGGWALLARSIHKHERRLSIHSDQQHLTSLGGSCSIQPICKVHSSARHIEVQWFGTIHTPQLFCVSLRLLLSS